MQTSGSNRKFTVKGIGLVAAIGFLSTGLYVACTPGGLQDCGKDTPEECFPIAGGGDSGAGGGGGGGGTGGRTDAATGGTGGGTGGGGGGSDAGPPGGSVSAATAVNCTAYPTVGEIETKLLLPQCGTSGCHMVEVPFPPQLAGTDVFKRLVDVSAKTLCKTEKYVDKATPATSFFVRRSRMRRRSARTARRPLVRRCRSESRPSRPATSSASKSTPRPWPSNRRNRRELSEAGIPSAPSPGGPHVSTRTVVGGGGGCGGTRGRVGGLSARPARLRSHRLPGT